jgi:hypothetical protein
VMGDREVTLSCVVIIVAKAISGVNKTIFPQIT